MACLVTIRAGQEMRQWPLDEWTTFVVLAALSAEPETFDELAEAIRRYLPEHRLLEQDQQVTRLEQAVSGDGPWCLVDLAGRTVVGGGGFEVPEAQGAYEVDEHDQTDGFQLVWLDTPPDWVFQQAEEDWQQVTAERAEAVGGRSRLDTREVLFGRPLLEHLAAGVMAGIAEYREASKKQQWELTNKIHATWLMAPRDDLNGRTPRQLLLADRERITRDLEHRAHQWSMQRFAPPALSRDSLAYRFGGFGTTEVVLYYDLVRSLLDEAWRGADAESGATDERLIEQLAAHRDQWLVTQHENGGGPETPSELIESERRRMPVTSDGSHLDCDCPICQVEVAGGFGPMFMWFDGHHLELEDEFAFSLIESREEWQWEHADCQELSEAMDPKQAEQQVPPETDDSYGSAWQSSFVSETAMSPDAPPGTAVLALGFRLAELVNDVKQRSNDRTHVEALNEAYLKLHAAQSALVMQPAAELLCEQLEAVADEYPDLVSKSADLQSCLQEVLRHSHSNDS